VIDQYAVANPNRYFVPSAGSARVDQPSQRQALTRIIIHASLGLFAYFLHLSATRIQRRRRARSFDRFLRVI
jgi:hypothetical protein